MNQSDLTLFNTLAQQLLAAEQKQPVPTAVDAKTLFEEIDLTLTEEPSSRKAFESVLSDLVIKTPKTSSASFFNQLFGGRRSEAILGDLLAVMLNSSMYTYKVAGPMVGVEKAVLHALIDIIGYPSTADGTFASGGSLSNLMAMLMARDAKDATIRAQGIDGKYILYTSAESHYSIPKNAAFIGIGREQVRYIKVDDQGRMLPSDLESQIKLDLSYGNIPFFVNATAGTTVLGAFDPVVPIAAICKKNELWLHVDGAYGGGVVLSNSYEHLVDGVSLSDSFSFNAHKMLNTTMTCSIIVARDKKHLHESFSNAASYLYQTDDDDYNLGKTSLQCGRRNDALKVWTLWKAVGSKGLEKIVDNQFYLADVARDYIRSNSNYTLYSFDDSLNVCFNYKNIDPKELCHALYEHAELMVSYGTFQGQTFVRFVTINSDNGMEEILRFFQRLEAFADLHF